MCFVVRTKLRKIILTTKSQPAKKPNAVKITNLFTWAQ